MDWKNFIIIGIFFILGAIISFIFFQFTQEAIITGDAICIAEYSFTKAICNDTNYCRDYEVICNGQELITLKPITGAVAQYPDNWIDPRTEEEIYRVCD